MYAERVLQSIHRLLVLLLPAVICWEVAVVLHNLTTTNLVLASPPRGCNKNIELDIALSARSALDRGSNF